jgi:hypothetical protein
MCDKDFEMIGGSPNPVPARMAAALAEMRDGGSNRDFAISVVALSEAESGAIWRLHRPATKTRDPIDCCGQIVGLEPARFDSVAQDAPALAWLQARGLVGVGQNGGIVPAGELANPFKHRAAMLFLEYCVATDQVEALRAFAIGPTMLNIGVNPNWPDAPHVCGVPPNKQELWAFYSSSDAADTLSRLTYLMPKSVSPSGCLDQSVSLPTAGRTAAITWLSHHTGGGLATAEQVYEGTYPGRPIAYKTSLQTAQAQASVVWH